MTENEAKGCVSVDLVMCLDKTAIGVYAEIHQYVRYDKDSLERLSRTIREHYGLLGLGVADIRIRFVLYGDYCCDEEPMIETAFLDLDNEREDIFTILDYRFGGGGDIPEHGLEALAIAMRSDFRLDDPYNKRIICFFTDSPAHSLGNERFWGLAGYPEDMPKSLDELRALWFRDGEPLGTIFLFAPRCEPWCELDYTVHTETRVCACNDVEMFDMLLEQLRTNLSY